MVGRANGIARVPRAPLVVRGDTLGGPLFRRESFIQGVKWLTFVGKAPLQVLSFRVKLLCVPRKILIAQATHAFEGKGFAGFIFFARLPWNIVQWSVVLPVAGLSRMGL